MTFTDSSVVLSRNLLWLMESRPVWTLLKSGTAGHLHHSFECCSKYTSSMMWCRQVRYRRSLSDFCSKRMQAPARCSVFDDVVSKHMALTRSATLQSCNRVYTAAAVFSPLVSFGTPSSLFTPRPNTRTGSWSTCSFPVRSCKSFPSQWTTSGTEPLLTFWSFLIEAAKLVQHPFRFRLMVDLLTVISAALQ